MGPQRHLLLPRNRRGLRLFVLAMVGALLVASLAALPAPPAEGTTPPNSILPVAQPAILVDSGVDGIEGKRAVAGDGSQFLVVWRTSPGGDVYGSLVSHDLASVVGPIPIFAAVNDAGLPAVGFDGTNFVVFFEHIPAGESQWELYGVRVASDGTVLDPGGVRLTTGATMRPWRRIAVEFDGANFMVAWRTDGSDIYAARIDPTPAVSPPQLENLDGPTGVVVSDVNQSFYPSIAFDGTNYLVVWHDNRAAAQPGWEVYAARVTTAGVVLDADGFVVASGTENMDHTGVAFDGSNYLVAWMDDRAGLNGQDSLYGARVTPAGAVLDAFPYIEIANNRAGGPAAVVSDGDGWLVAWTASLGGNFDRGPYNRLGDVMARQVEADGSVARLPIPIAVGEWHQISPVLAHDSGTILVGWHDLVSHEVSSGGIAVRTLARVPGPGLLQPVPATPIAAGWAPEVVPTFPDSYAGERFVSDLAVHSIDEAYASAESVVLQRTSAGWAIDYVPVPSSLWGMWAEDAAEAWTSGWAGIAHVVSPDTGEWDYLHPLVEPPDGHQFGVVGTADGWVFMSELSGQVRRYDRDLWVEEWTSQPLTVVTSEPVVTSHDLFDIWGTAADGLWAVGATAAMVRYDGAAWSPVMGLPVVQTLNAVHGSAPNNVFAVGDYGAIIHWDGSTWTAMDGGTTSHLFDVWVGGYGEAYAVGYDGTITHFDGTSWTPQVSGTTEHLYAADGLRESSIGVSAVWVGGNGETILRQDVPLAIHPVAVEDYYMATEDQLLVATVAGPLVGVLGNDWDPEAQEGSFTATLLTTTRNGSLALDADGSFTYDPDPDFNGIDTFWYTLDDGHGGTDAAEVVIEVAAVNDPPVAVDDGGPEYTIEEEGRLEVWGPGVLGNDSDPVEGDPLESVLVDTTEHGLLDLSPDGHFVYTVDQNFHGTDTFTYRAWDGADYSNVATVTVTVTPVNDPPVANGDDGPYTTEETMLLTVNAPGVLANDTDADGDPLSAQLVDDAVHGTLSLAPDGSFTYQPHAPFAGIDSFSYAAWDGNALSLPVTVEIEVTGVYFCNAVHATILGTTGTDTLSGTAGADVIVSLSGDDTIDGNGGDDTICSGAGNDQVSGGGGDDWIAAGRGFDVVDGGSGNDTLHGGPNRDIVSYRSAPSGVTVQLGLRTATGGDGSDSLAAFEVVYGSNHSDFLVGNALANGLRGFAGNDLIKGQGGNDTVGGGPGNDTLLGGPGDDRIEGNAGTDLVRFSASSARVIVKLFAGTATGEGTDTLVAVENVVGSRYNDWLIGGTSVNVIYGGNGNDRLYGNAANDNLIGQGGDDWGYGGPGSDRCRVEIRSSCER